MPRARNKIETARHVYFSLEMYSLRRMMSAVRQQLTIARKYRITVSQPPIVGSPIPGLQSNSCIRGSWLLALRNESWPDLSILISFELRAWRSTMTTAFGIVVVFVLSGVAIADASPMQALSLKLERLADTANACFSELRHNASCKRICVKAKGK